MYSQVSFKIDGEHNKAMTLFILSLYLKGLKYRFENEGGFTFRVYVRANDTDANVMQACKRIQCFAVYDYNRAEDQLTSYEVLQIL